MSIVWESQVYLTCLRETMPKCDSTVFLKFTVNYILLFFFNYQKQGKEWVRQKFAKIGHGLVYCLLIKSWKLSYYYKIIAKQRLSYRLRYAGINIYYLVIDYSLLGVWTEQNSMSPVFNVWLQSILAELQVWYIKFNLFTKFLWNIFVLIYCLVLKFFHHKFKNLFLKSLSCV